MIKSNKSDYNDIYEIVINFQILSMLCTNQSLNVSSTVISTRPIHHWRICIFVNTLRPRQNGRYFADDTFKRIFLNETFRFLIEISLKFVPKGPINNIPSLVKIMAWRRSGDKPLSEPMMVWLLRHICVTRPQWVNSLSPGGCGCELQKCHFQTHCYELISWVFAVKLPSGEWHGTSLMNRQHWLR